MIPAISHRTGRHSCFGILEAAGLVRIESHDTGIGTWRELWQLAGTAEATELRFVDGLLVKQEYRTLGGTPIIHRRIK